MAAITPYPKYSAYQHIPSSDLMLKGNELFEAIFPNDSLGNNSSGGIKISTFLITSSAGKYTLLLGDTLSFVNLRNSYDPLREICPVIFSCGPRSCSAELQQAVRDHGVAIVGSPQLVALEIDLDTRNSCSKFFYRSYSGLDPQAELIRAINLQAGEVYIGKYRIKKIENTWQPPIARLNWQGLAFEQSDRVIRTWLHGANPQALARACNKAQQSIDSAVKAENRKLNEIQQKKINGRYADQLKEQLDRELYEIRQTLQGYRNQFDYLTAQTVNSAAQTTLQCAITMQVDPDKIELLKRFVCQRIVTTIDRALDKVSWEELQIGRETIENFIKQKLKALKQRIPVLAERSAKSEAEWDDSVDFQPVLTMGRGRTLTDWVNFRDEVMPNKQAWAKQTFQQFCQQKVGHSNPTSLERPVLESEWKQTLSEKLKWVTTNLRRSDEDLKIMEDHTFVGADIKIFDAYSEQMVKVLQKRDQWTYGLGLELTKLYQERDFLSAAARHRQCVHLVKRITTDGHVYFGVAPASAKPRDRPDPNSDLNEVHIPVLNVPNLVRHAARNQRPPQRASSHTWKWIATGVAVVLGAWRINRYLKPQST